MFSEKQLQILKSLANASLTPKAISLRAKILLLYSEGYSLLDICEKLGVSYTPVYKWRKRWLIARDSLNKIQESQSNYVLKKSIEKSLKDSSRSGAPPQFTGEQVTKIIALACSSPQLYNIPVSHWSCRLLAEQAKKLKIVESISFKQISVFLKSRGIKTSQSTMLVKF